MYQFYSKIKNMGSYSIQFINCVLQQGEGQHGLSHLVEHCMCQPIKKYDKKFRQNGITWNAETSKTQMVFYMTGLSKNIKKFINDFTNDILTYEIPKEVFERQRKIVISEYKMYYSDDMTRFKLNWLRAHYNYPGTLGLLSDLENITYQKFIQFKKRITKMVKQTYLFTNKSKNVFDYNQEVYKNLHYNITDQRYDIDKHFFNQIQTEYPMQRYSTGKNTEKYIFLEAKIDYKKDKFKQIALSKLFCSYLAGDLSSYLYQELRQKLGCIYNIGIDIDTFEKQGYIIFSIQTDQKHLDLVINHIKKILPKLNKKLSKRTFSSIYKAAIMKYKILLNTNYSNFGIIIDEKTLKINKFLEEKSITFDEFKQFTQEFIQNYRIFLDENY